MRSIADQQSAVSGVSGGAAGGGVAGGGVAGGSHPPGTPVDVLVRPEGLAVTPSAQGRGVVMTATFLGSITRLGVPLDEDVMVYAVLSNSEVAVPTGSAVEVTLTERSVMVADRTELGGSVVAPLEVPAPDH